MQLIEMLRAHIRTLLRIVSESPVAIRRGLSVSDTMKKRTAMEGKTCLITGGSDGIGYFTARELAQMGASVVIADQNATKTPTAVARIIEETGNRSVRYLLADLSSQGEVRSLADQIKTQVPRLDVLVNNAGAVFLSSRRSVEGIEMTFALNHLGYFLLTTLLLDLLKDSAPARIVNVSSSYHASAGNFSLEDLPTLNAAAVTGHTHAPNFAISCSPTNWRDDSKVRV